MMFITSQLATTDKQSTGRSHAYWLEEARKPVSEQHCPAPFARAADFHGSIVGKWVSWAW